MKRAALLLPLILSACVGDGYVLRSASVNAGPGTVGFTMTFDNVYLPVQGDTCTGVCDVVVD